MPKEVRSRKHGKFWEDFYNRLLAEARRVERQEFPTSDQLTRRRRTLRLIDVTLEYRRQKRRELLRLPRSAREGTFASVRGRP